ncbi:MAG: phospho-N-acetylmuramoyl-pentapeptide-transferase [Firmicutes bacterium]|nr:phospho-N-acetylmuramoyl-pentapeptide-transferase [Bacillota bacterium]
MNLITIIAIFVGFVITYGAVVLAMPSLIDYLHEIKFGQTERHEENYLESHIKKNGTPTMGGMAFIIAPIVVYILLCLARLAPMDFYAVIIIMAFAGYGIIGFIDDYIIVVKKDNAGLKPAQKFALQSVLAIAFYMLYTQYMETTLFIPVFKATLPIGILYFVLIFIMFTAESNATNLTDGVDGLCAGLMCIALIPFLVFAYVQSIPSVVIFICCVEAGLLGYLKFNKYPAKIFMGDTGSLALGGLIAAIAMVLKQEILLVLIGGVFVAETLSVIIQVSYYKKTKKRIFLMAPLHHHFEKKGWSEVKVVTRFYLVGALLAILGLCLGLM